MDQRSKACADVVECVLTTGAYKAIKYLSESLTVKATQKRYKAYKKLPKWHSLDIVLTIGKPNYEEREFIKKCKKAGELVPVKKVQMKFAK